MPTDRSRGLDVCGVVRLDNYHVIPLRVIRSVKMAIYDVPFT